MRFLEKTCRQLVGDDWVGTPFDETQIDVIANLDRRTPLLGIVMGDEALMLDQRACMSFRVRSGNLGMWKKCICLKCVSPIDKNILRHYFQENADNPYALQNVLNNIRNGWDLATLTQFPPLSRVPRTRGEFRRALETLLAKTKSGDTIFSTDSGSSISAAIRKYDFCQFSHCAIYLGGGKVADLGPGGYRANSLFDLDPSSRLATYTQRIPLKADERALIVEAAWQQVRTKGGFSYPMLVALFLRNRLRIPVARHLPSVSDLLNANDLALVGYL